MSLATETVTSNTVTEEKRVTGVCKWFNNKSGYGFLTITEGEKKDSDIFVYHSSLQVENEKQYKYLVQGEYVDFIVSNVESSKSQDKYEYHATSVTGINGGKLMCETRNESKVTRPKLEITKSSFSSRSPSRRLVKNEKLVLEKSLESVESVESVESDKPLEKDDLTQIISKDLAITGRGRGRPPKSLK
jgi:cold shock CspA family protein